RGQRRGRAGLQAACARSRRCEDDRRLHRRALPAVGAPAGSRVALVAQLSDDCFAGGGPLMRAGEALDRLLGGLVAVTEPRRVPLINALDRILADPVVATIDVPGRDNSAVDGYAVYFDDLDPATETRLPVRGRAAAGHPVLQRQRRGEAVRVFTGAL